MKDQVCGADGGQVVQVQVCADGQRDGASGPEHDGVRVEHDGGHQSDPELRSEPPAQQLPKAPIHGRLPAARPYVLSARKPLLDESERLGARVTLGLGVGHGQVAHPGQDSQHHGAERGQGQPRSPVLSEEQHQYSDQQQNVAEEADDEGREESAQLVGVAVDSLDHLARRMLVVEGHVERQAVLREIGPESVGGGPADAAARVRRQHVDELLGNRDDREERGGAYQPADRAAGESFVDEVADYLRAEELKTDADEQKRRHGGHQARLRTQVARQQVYVLTETYAGSRRGQRLEALSCHGFLSRCLP